MEVARRDFILTVGAAAAGLSAAVCALGASAGAEEAGASKQEDAASGSQGGTEADETTESVDNPTSVTIAAPGQLDVLEDNIEYKLADGLEEPDYGARIKHVFGANSLMDYYLFDGFTGIGIDEKNDKIVVRDLVMEPSGGSFGNVVLKDGGSGDAQSKICDVRSVTYTTPEGKEVTVRCQTLHGANPKLDGMVVYTTNKPAKLNRSLKVPLDCFDGPLTRQMNYLLGNPDSGKHNTASREDDGIDDTSINFHFNEDDEIKPGLQHIYTKYAHNGKEAYWLYIESENCFDVRTDALGTGDKGEAGYVEGTSLNMSVREPADGAYHATVKLDPTNPDRLCFPIAIDDVFYFDPADAQVVHNASLTDEREFPFWKAQVGASNTALSGEVAVSCDMQTPGMVYLSIQCDKVAAGEFDLDVSVSAGRGTGWATEWSETPASVKVKVTE